MSQTFRLGQASPGAGQVYWPLQDATGAEAGDLHAFNPGMLTTPADALTPTFVEVKLGGAAMSCRWVAHTRLLAVSARRTLPRDPGGGRRPDLPDLRLQGRRERQAGPAGWGAAHHHALVADRRRPGDGDADG
ncbi:MAG: hypothetical protein WDM92_04715 [Caulobacteraceae bacterium]